jgi:hypothetical protein
MRRKLSAPWIATSPLRLDEIARESLRELHVDGLAQVIEWPDLPITGTP